MKSPVLGVLRIAGFALAALAIPAGALTPVDTWGDRDEVRREIVADAAGGLALRGAAPKATPVVAVTSPANGAVFVAPATVALAASATVTGATLTKVEFHRNGALLATDTTAPYAYSWTNVAAGTYALTVKAYDNAGGATTSATVSITVKPNAAPSVALTAPAPNMVVAAPATINLSAGASDSDGSVAKVEFFRGTTRLATDTSAPYAHAWTNVGAGTYSLTARATDDKGAVTTSTPVSVIVNRPPVTAITAPAGNATLVAPLNLTVTASASDGDGSIAKVEFLRNGMLAATDTSSPYSFVWSNVPLGTHTLASRATDNRGATTTSTPVTFTVSANVPPSVAITSPAPGARFSYPASVPIAATATDVDGTIARVEFHYDYGLLASDSSSPYSYTWKSPYNGTFALTARAIDSKGAVTTSSPVTITIAANQPPTVTLAGNPPGGVVAASAPPTFVLTATPTDPDGTIASVRFLRYETSLDAFVVFAGLTQGPYVVHYDAPTLDAEYWFRVEAVDNAGDIGSADLVYSVVANRAPEARIVEPGTEVEWSGFVGPATVVVVVEAREFDAAPDRIVHVDVLANGTPIASIMSPDGAGGEFVHVWRDVGPGTYSVVVRAFDAFGAVGEWQRTIRVLAPGPNATVTLAQPVSGQVYRGAVPLQAVVASGASAVSRVDYVNTWGRKVGSSSIAPFAATWNAPPAGRHGITAIVMQADGVAVASPTSFIDVADAGSKRAPLVVLTAPAASGSFGVHAPLAVKAEAHADTGATITAVEFFANGLPIGTATSAPYQIAWTNAPVGTVTLTARATDSTSPAVGSSATSSPISVTLASSNPPPTVALTAPDSGAAFAAPATIALAASASDANGTIAKVAFHANDTLVGADTTAPFALTWSDVPAGSYAITATATDNGGASTTSAPRTVTVVTNVPPHVSLDSPASGQTFAFGVPVTLAASASDTDGAVARVEFLAGTTVLASDTSAPYSHTWNAAAVGTHAVAARATDSLGATATSPSRSITITANALPSVALAVPRAGQQFVTGQTVQLVATADDADGAVARVDFLSGSTMLGSATAAPFALAWSNVPGGSHTLTARAVDDRGAVRTSGTITIHVAPLAATIAFPGENAQIALATTLVHGTFAAPANSGVLVNGVRAQVEGHRYLAADVPLAEGPGTIRVVVVTADGNAIEATRSVTRVGATPLTVHADGESGFAPHTATLRIDNPGGLIITQVAFENLGAATLDTAGADQSAVGRLTLASPGIATPTVVLTDSTGAVHRVPVGILATSRAALDTMLKEIMGTYTAMLSTGRVDLALATLSPVVAARYKPILEPLAPHLRQIVSTWSPPQTGVLAEDIAEYTVARTIDGQKRLFFLYLVRDGQGSWRLDSM